MAPVSTRQQRLKANTARRHIALRKHNPWFLLLLYLRGWSWCRLAMRYLRTAPTEEWSQRFTEVLVLSKLPMRAKILVHRIAVEWAISQQVQAGLPASLWRVIQAIAETPRDVFQVCQRGIGTAALDLWRLGLASLSAALAPFDWLRLAFRMALVVLLLGAVFWPTTTLAGPPHLLHAALGVTTILEVEVGGDDTNNGGMFDPGKVSAGGFTDGAATSATTSAPVFTSASYNFVAGDVGAWLYIQSGTNWIPGFYKIASVASNAATLTATIGTAALYGQDVDNLGSTITIPFGPNNRTGCATTGSPTGAKWSIDYSQQTALRVAYTDLVSAGTGLTVSSAAKPFGRQQVGNGLCITSGTNFNVGRYVIASVAAVTFIATVVGPTNITTGAGAAGVGNLGGAFNTPGAMGALFTINGMTARIQSGTTYSATSATVNIAGGVYSSSARGLVFGYTTHPWLGNTDTKPIIQSNVSTATLWTSDASTITYNITFDGNSQTASKLSANGFFVNCLLKNSNTASTATNTCQCQITANSAVVSTGGIGSMYTECYANTATPIANATAIYALSVNNTGTTTDGVGMAPNLSMADHCTLYGNGRDGVRLPAGIVTNCYGEDNSVSVAAFNFNATDTARSTIFLACGTLYTGGAGIADVHGTVVCWPALVILSTTAFTNAAGNDFSLNNTATGGALLRGKAYNSFAGGAFSRGLTTGYGDIGAVQSQASASGGASSQVFGG